MVCANWRAQKKGATTDKWTLKLTARQKAWGMRLFDRVAGAVVDTVASRIILQPVSG